jgi:hypothetical protein
MTPALFSAPAGFITDPTDVEDRIDKLRRAPADIVDLADRERGEFGNGCGQQHAQVAAGLHDLRLPMLLPGITISSGPGDYAPIKQMQLQKFDGSSWKVFGDVIKGSGD